jgi:transcriptional regulator with XRE-family HTH domain
MPATFDENLVQKLRQKEYRDAYAEDVVRMSIARQIRTLREQEDREWSQAELGRRMGKPQSVVSRLEDPDYGRLTLQTLFEVAAGFDLPLWVEIIEWEEFFDRSTKILPKDLERKSFDPDRLATTARQAAAITHAVHEGNVVELSPKPQPRTSGVVAKPLPGREWSGAVSVASA